MIFFPEECTGRQPGKFSWKNADRQFIAGYEKNDIHENIFGVHLVVVKY